MCSKCNKLHKSKRLKRCIRKISVLSATYNVYRVNELAQFSLITNQNGRFINLYLHFSFKLENLLPDYFNPVLTFFFMKGTVLFIVHPRG